MWDPHPRGCGVWPTLLRVWDSGTQTFLSVGPTPSWVWDKHRLDWGVPCIRSHRCMRRYLIQFLVQLWSRCIQIRLQLIKFCISLKVNVSQRVPLRSSDYCFSIPGEADVVGGAGEMRWIYIPSSWFLSSVLGWQYYKCLTFSDCSTVRVADASMRLHPPLMFYSALWIIYRRASISFSCKRKTISPVRDRSRLWEVFIKSDIISGCTYAITNEPFCSVLFFR